MFIIIGIMLTGMLFGYLLRSKRLTWIHKIITFLIWVLLFLLGIDVGGNDIIVKGLHTLGLEALIITLAAVIGVWFSFRRMKKKDNLKTVCYLLMSWVVIIAFKPLIDVFQRTDSMYVLYWLIGGGLFYSLGTIFFFLDKYKYMHSAWHLFVLGGTVCHFIAIYNLV